MLLPTQYLNPAVLRCTHFDGYPLGSAVRMEERTVYDYELEYYLRSGGGILINGVYQSFRAGELNIRKPGQRVAGMLPYECYTLCVDLIGNAKRSGDYQFGTQGEAQELYENPLLAGLPDRLALRKRNVAETLMENILHSAGEGGDLAYFRVKSSVYMLFSEIFSELSEVRATGSTLQIRSVVRLIQERYSEPLHIEALIRESGMSRGFFHQQFKRETGVTPGKLITSLRMDKARNLLSITSLEVGEIAALCGYLDNAYFARIFRRETGFTPSGYRESIRKSAMIKSEL